MLIRQKHLNILAALKVGNRICEVEDKEKDKFFLFFKYERNR